MFSDSVTHRRVVFGSDSAYGFSGSCRNVSDAELGVGIEQFLEAPLSVCSYGIYSTFFIPWLLYGVHSCNFHLHSS